MSSRLVLHLRSSNTFLRQYSDSMVVVVRFIFVPLSHSLRRTPPRVNKKDLSAPLATESQAPTHCAHAGEGRAHNNFSVCLGTQPARNPADTSWSREVKLDREIVESSSHASGYNLVSHAVSFSREGRLHCEVVCMFPTNKVLTQVCSFFLTQVRVFPRTVVLDRASVSRRTLLRNTCR